MTIMDRTETNIKFFDLIGNMELREDGVRDLINLDEIQNHVLSCLNDYLQLIGDVDITDNEEAYIELCQTLSSMINRDIAHSEVLEYDDELVSTDDIIYMVIDEDETAEIIALQDGSRFSGNYSFAVVTKTPDPMVMMEPGRDYEADYSPVPHTDFGVGFVLANVKITHDDGSEEIVPDDKTLLVPLGFIPLPLKKVLPLDGE